MSAGTLGVVILSYGSGGEYRKLLDSLLAEGILGEAIVVVHNPSSPGERPDSIPEACELVVATHNLGYAGGMNLGITRQLARGAELILLLTHDARLRGGAVTALVSAARRVPGCGVLGPMLVLAGTDMPFSFGGKTRSNGSVAHLRERPDRVENGVSICDWIDGGTMLVRSATFDQVGMFDEDFWSYCEEADFCLRARRAGFEVGVVADAVAEGAPGGSRRVGAWSYLLTRNGIEFARRAVGVRGVAYMLGRSLSLAGFGFARALARAAHLRSGDPDIPKAEAVGCARGVAAYLSKTWGPPPSMPGETDISNTRPPRTTQLERPRVLQMGPGPAGVGGMSASMRALLESPLSDIYALDVVSTYGHRDPGRRLVTYCLALLKLASWRIRRRGRIVHVHSAVRGSMYRKSVCVLLAKALRSRVVLQVHAGPGDVNAFFEGIGPISRALFVAAFRAADVRLAVSEASAAAIEAAGAATDVSVVPNAAPPVSGAPAADDPDEPRVVYLGGFADPVKGGKDLVAALATAMSAAPGMGVVLAGPGELPEAGHDLIGRHSGVEWRGLMDEGSRDAALRRSNIFVLPSTSEGLPMALLEAMASGLAIVATEVGGVPEVLESERDAVFATPGRPEELAGALVRLAGDPGLRARLGAAAQARARGLDATMVTARLAAIYADLLGGAPSPPSRRL